MSQPTVSWTDCRILLIVQQWEYFPASRSLFIRSQSPCVHPRSSRCKHSLRLRFFRTKLVFQGISIVRKTIRRSLSSSRSSSLIRSLGSKLFFVKKKKKKKKMVTRMVKICWNICWSMNNNCKNHLDRVNQWLLYPLINERWKREDRLC